MNKKNLLDISIIGLLLSLLFSIHNVGVARDIDVNIYSTYPSAVWALFVMLCILLSFAVAHERYNTVKYATICLVVVAVLFSLPHIRGYLLYGRGGADILSHLGQIQSVSNSGSIGSNHYPLLHILGSVLHLIGVRMEAIPAILTIVFYSLYLVSMFVFGSALFRSSTGGAFTAAFSLPFLYGWEYVTAKPYLLSTFLIPLLLFTLERGGKRNTVIGLALTLTISFFHPTTTILVAMILLVFGLLNWPRIYQFQILESHKSLWEHKRTFLTPFTLLITTMAIFFVWYWQFDFAQVKSQQFLLYFVSDLESQSLAESTAESSVTYTIGERVIRFLEVYGPIVLYASITSIYILLRAVLYRRYDYQSLLTTLNFALAGAFGFVTLYVYVFGFNIIRVSRYAIIIATVGVAAAMLQLRQFDRRYAYLAIVVILLVTFPLTVSNMFVDQRTSHLTQTEADGAAWVLDERGGRDIVAYDMSYKQQAYANGHGSFTRGSSDDVFAQHEFVPPQQLCGSQSGELFTNSTLYVTKDYDLVQHLSKHSDVQDQAKAYDERTVESCVSDNSSMNKVYENSGFTAWGTED